jgi:hypothetical protein
MRECRNLRRNGAARLVEGRERVSDADDPPVLRVVELDQPELDDLVLGMIEAGRLGIEQNARPDLLPMVGMYVGRATRRRRIR